MDIADTFGELKHYLAGFLWRKVMAAYEIEFVAKGSSIDILVGHIWSSINGAMTDDFDDVWVIKRSASDAFMLKTLDVLWVVHHVFAHDLEGNGLMEDNVKSLIDIGHAAMGDSTGYSVTVIYLFSNLNHC